MSPTARPPAAHAPRPTPPPTSPRRPVGGPRRSHPGARPNRRLLARGAFPDLAHAATHRGGQRQPELDGDRATTDRFWYRNNTGSGYEFVLVNPAAASREQLFDHYRLASAMSLANDTSYVPEKLPFSTFRFGDTEGDIEFVTGGRRFLCDIVEYACTVADTLPSRAAFVESPDGRWEAFAHEYNLYVRAAEGGDSIQLTTDGEKYYAYGYNEPRPNQVRQGAGPRAPTLSWSPRFPPHRGLPAGRARRGAHALRFLHAATPPPLLPAVCVAGRHGHPSPDRPHPGARGDRPSRGRRSGSSRDRQPPGRDRPDPASALLCRLRSGLGVERRRDPAARQLLHPRLPARIPGRDRRRDGRLKGDSGRLHPDLRIARAPGRRVERGDALVARLRERRRRDLVVRTRWLGTPLPLRRRGEPEEPDHLGTVGGGRGPARRRGAPAHPFRGPRPRTRAESLLRPPLPGRVRRHGSHAADARGRQSRSRLLAERRLLRGHVLPDRGARRSSHCAAPTTASSVLELERADISAIEEIGFTPAEVFTAKARDGVTDLYGVLHLPPGLDQDAKYPIISHIYPGPQVGSVGAWAFKGGGEDFALAQLGFVVVQIDHLGTPHRFSRRSTTTTTATSSTTASPTTSR